MSLRTEAVILEQIVAAIDGAMKYASVSKAEFLTDQMRQDAMVRKLEIIGEAAKGLRDLAAIDAALDVAMAEDADAWKGAAGMRDRLIHKYWAIDLEIVWSTVTSDLPGLKQAVAKLQGRPHA